MILLSCPSVLFNLGLIRNCRADLVFVGDAPVSVRKEVLRLGRAQGPSIITSCFCVQLTERIRISITNDTDQLHQKIAEMSQRIRQLEDALAILQSGVSTTIHPLLEEDLLAIKLGPELRPPIESEAPEEQADNSLADTIDAFGTLAIGE